MNQLLQPKIEWIQVGRCGYCGCRIEDYDPAHSDNRCWRKVLLEREYFEAKSAPTYKSKRK